MELTPLALGVMTAIAAAICLPLAYLLGTRRASQAQAELTLLKQQQSQLEAQLLQAQEDENRLQQALHQAELTHSKVQAEKGFLETQASQQQEQLSKLEDQWQSVTAELASCQRSQSAVQAELVAVKQHSAEYQAKLKQLDQQVPELQSALASCQQRSAELTTLLDERSAALNKATATLNQKEQQLAQAMAEQRQLSVDVGERKTELEALSQERLSLQARLQTTEETLQQHRLQLNDARTSLSSLQAMVQSKEEQIADLQNREQQASSNYQRCAAELQQLKQLQTELTTRMEEKERHVAEQLQLLQQNKAEFKSEFEALSNEILSRKETQLKELNRESLAGIINPIHEELKGFKSKVETIHQQETEQRVKLRTELENLQKLNQQITDQADKLTKALKGEKKVQGNWGELMLENVLDSSGLRLGIDYQREVHLEGDDGRFRPDVVVHLPQDKHMVIDAKTSLNAYTRFVNADDELERQAALKEHANAVKDRISELAKKDYGRLPGLNSPEVVIMFIPIESAYVEALRADESIFQKAIEQKVLVTTPTTLLTSLNIVRQLWRFEEQNKHTAELANRAERFYQKLNNFLESMMNVGKQIDKAKSNYDDALKQLYTGRGNLILQASQFKELGVAVSKELPAELVKAARLELNQGQHITAIRSGEIELEVTDDVV